MASPPLVAMPRESDGAPPYWTQDEPKASSSWGASCASAQAATHSTSMLSVSTSEQRSPCMYPFGRFGRSTEEQLSCDVSSAGVLTIPVSIDVSKLPPSTTLDITIRLQTETPGPRCPALPPPPPLPRAPGAVDFLGSHQSPGSANQCPPQPSEQPIVWPKAVVVPSSGLVFK